MSRFSLLGFAAIAVAIGRLSMSPGVVVEVVHPECVHCDAAFLLADLQLIDAGRALAAGHHVAKGNSGAGESALLRTDDGGRSWRQLPLAFQQHEPPPFFVLNAMQAWASFVDMETGDSIVTHTSDGGNTWKPNKTDDGSFQALQFLDELRGYAVSYRLGEGCNFAATTDGGVHWGLRPIAVQFVERLHFVNQQVGWIVGIGSPNRKTGVTVLRTSDGGSTWTAATLEGGREVAVRDFEWADRDRGFLVVSSVTEGKREVFATGDGGATWLPWQREPFGRGGWAIDQIRFVSPELGIAVGRKGGHPYLGWTDDSGLNWREQELGQPATSCAAVGRTVWCIAGSDLLRISLK